MCIFWESLEWSLKNDEPIPSFPFKDGESVSERVLGVSSEVDMLYFIT
jgi:hypothetical protein